MPAGIMLSQLAKYLLSVGHEVMVYTTFPSLPEGNVFAGYERHLWRLYNQDGIGVTRCFSFVYGRDRKRLNRILAHLSFTITVTVRLLLDRKPDVFIVETFPVITSPWIVVLARLLRVRCVNYVQDLYPEVLEDAGLIERDGYISKLARLVDRLTCTWADVNLVPDDSFKEFLTRSRGTQESRIVVIRNWIDGSRIQPGDRENPWRELQGIPSETLVAMFAGTVGVASGADVLVEAARELRMRGWSDILILCIGEGVLKGPMLEEAKRFGLDNIRFLPFQPEEELALVQSTADVMLLTLSKKHVESSVPSKLITYLAVGRPVLCSADPVSPVAKTIQNANIGWVVPPGDSVALADSLGELRRNQRRRRQMGMRAREYFEKNYDILMAMDKWGRLVRMLAEES